MSDDYEEDDLHPLKGLCILLLIVMFCPVSLIFVYFWLKQRREDEENEYEDGGEDPYPGG